MAAKKVRCSEEARLRMIRGVTILADAVEVTQVPKGGMPSSRKALGHRS